MNRLSVVGLLLGLQLSAQAFGAGLCEQDAKKAALRFYAAKLKVPVEALTVRAYTPGAWTEMPGSNTGNAEVTVALHRSRGQTIRVRLNQIGMSDRCRATASL